MMCKQGAKKYLEYKGLVFDFDSAVVGEGYALKN
jgi:hypothetical protein